jgi:hypothetical protein
VSACPPASLPADSLNHQKADSGIPLDSIRSATALEELFPLNSKYLTIQCSHPGQGGSGGLSCSEAYGKGDKRRMEYTSLAECERSRDRMNGEAPAGGRTTWSVCVRLPPIWLPAEASRATTEPAEWVRQAEDYVFILMGKSTHRLSVVELLCSTLLLAQHLA